MQIHGQILILSIPAELHFRPRLVLSIGTVDPVPRSLYSVASLGGHPAELETEHD
jgi:hypothetical protein